MVKTPPPSSAQGTPVKMDLVSSNDQYQADPKRGMFYKTQISNEVELPSLDEKLFAKETYERYYWLRKARKNILDKDIEEIWDNAERNVTGYVESLPDDEDRSNLFIPITHSTVDSILAEWYGQRTTGRITPADDEDPAADAKAQLVDFCRKHIEKRNNILNVDQETQYNILLYGNGVQHVYYKELLRKIHDVIGKNENGPIYKERIITDFDDVAIENVDLRMFFPDDAARQVDFSDMRDCVHRYIVPYQDFEVQYSNYENSKFVKIGGDLTEIDFFRKPRDMTLWDVEVLWWWNKNRDFLRVVANGILLCDIPNPYDHKELPYAGAGDIRRPGSFWWIGEPELIESLQEELNVNRNIRTDASRMAVLSPIFAPTTGKLEEDEIIVEPGKIYYYQGTIAPTQVKQNVDFGVSFQGEDRLKEDIATTTGVDKTVNQPGTATATEVASDKETTLKRISKKMYQHQTQLLARRGKLILGLIMQYYTVPKVSLIASPDMVEKYEEALAKQKQDPKHYYTGEDQAVYKKEYRRIRVENKQISVKPVKDNYDKTVGVELKVQDKKGYTFFEATPDLIKGNYQFDVVPDVDIPVTKAQKMEIANGMYDRLKDNVVINSPDGKMYINTATGQTAVPMPKGILKLTEQILKENGLEFEDYIPDEDNQDPMIAQAGKENVAMMAGEPLNPTPLADPQHTMIHVTFMDQNKIDPASGLGVLFNKHIVGEQRWQKQMALQMQQKQALQQAQQQAQLANQQNGQNTQGQNPDDGTSGAPSQSPTPPGLPIAPPTSPGGPGPISGNGPAHGGPAPRSS